ncbi:response regulator [Gracilibacillus alcaliphilus]|uniref:response regulator n=1 Tax=Gracilibacillus alcaliphilus TaxID=1401441 RepID=UPI00195C8EF2|nr:response regulator [Gracilibacillus alcaliphilus]MBM7677123.1 YesN/AraC family two-component response regulator [Gracilibacillus alcaliphilus]
MKALIVDDEKNIRERIQSFSIWRELRFTEVEAAADGVEALERIEIVRPDVIMTDIKMPKMDGIELIKQVTSRYPQIKIIILSAYDDFNYAKAAIQYGVKGYLLKPLIREELRQILSKMVSELENEQKGTDAFLKDNEQMLLDITKGERFDQYKPKLTANYYRVMILNFSEFFERNPSLILRKQVTEQIIQYLEGEDIPFLFSSNDLTLLMADVKPISKYDMEKFLQAFLTVISHTAFYPESPVVTGIGNLVANLDEIPQSYHQAVYSYHYKYFEPAQTVFFYQDIGKEITVREEQKADMEEIANIYADKMVSAMIDRTDCSIKQLVDDFFADLPSHHKQRVTSIREQTYKYVLLIHIKLKNEGYVSSISAEHSLWQQIHDTTSLVKLQHVTLDYLEQFKCSMEMMDQQNYNYIVKKAIEYVNKHYQEKITLDDIASLLFVNKTYFSNMFKQQTGENFVDYINRIRIEMSQELILKSELKMNEISEKVGFQSHSYFNKVFKKVMGQNPLHLRKTKQKLG